MKLTALIVTCLGLALGMGRLTAAEARVDLTGEVMEKSGAPMAGATVFIYTAGPKQGTSSLCPFCFADCQKKTETDAAGHFKLESLDSSLLFRLLVVAANHESQFVSKVDPAKGEKKVTLKPLNEAWLKSGLRIKGQVINEHGKPVPKAIITPQGIEMGEMTRWGGNNDEIEPLAVTDEAGRFVLFCKSNNVSTVYTVADGPGVTQQWATFKPGGDYLVKLPDGVTLTGQVLRDGKPVEGVSIGADTQERQCGIYFNCDAVSTDSNGRFMLLNVPPNMLFMVHSTMESLHGRGTIPDRLITTGDSGAVQDLGELKVQPAYRVAGRIVLSDGKPMPENIRLYLGRTEASDTQEAKLDANGHFEFKGVPGSSVSLALRIKGYRLSKLNPSLDWLNGDILGKVSGDVDDLTILMEPGAWDGNNQDQRPGGDDDYPRNKPLRSAKL